MKRSLWVFFCGLLLGCSAYADIRLPHVFGDHMVLQREQAVPVWGWSDPGETVTVSVGPQEKTAVADAEGKWRVDLDPMKASSDPLEMTIGGSSSGKSLTISNILVGDVWLCSGQSNMAFALAQAKTGKQEIPQADYPGIRFFNIRQPVSSHVPFNEVDIVWQECRSQTAATFSAVGFFFGRRLHTEVGIPIGLIASSLGGSAIEAWTPPEGFASVPETRVILDELKEDDERYREDVAASIPVVEDWVREAKTAIDEGTELPDQIEWPLHPIMKATPQRGITGLYNGAIHPLIPFGIRGVIWYQGESNAVDGMFYYHKMRALIDGWRALWKAGDFPFYYVQIAPCTHYSRQGDEYRLPKLWQAQSAALNITNTGMAVITDLVPDVTNIHPPLKREVGERLALWALAKDYGTKDIVYCGPLYKSMKVEGHAAHIQFDHTGSGLASRDGKPLNGFEIADAASKTFVHADAVISGDTVIVSSPEIANPAAVRFAWHNTAQPNLMNREGLPAVGFRTEAW